MDITVLFKACVKTVKATNKDLGIKTAKSNILQNVTKDPNMAKPREIFKHLTSLHSFFEENKLDYLNIASYLPATKKSMNELDREQIDSVAQKVISTCTTMVKEYRQEIAAKSKGLTEQKVQHYNNVINFIEGYLKDIFKMYNNAKATRLKRIMETAKISKLESIHPSKREPFTPSTNERKLFDSIENEVTKASKEHIKAKSKDKNELSSKQSEIKNTEDIDSKLPADVTLSAEEMQMFEAENDLLYNELNNLQDEVKQMENKVVHIAELQELFTEKVLQQEKEIERISHVVANTTDDVKDANEQIRQAIQRNAGLRVWVLFFLLIMSFSLLFLDWYND